jgi:hypothetical protein
MRLALFCEFTCAMGELGQGNTEISNRTTFGDAVALGNQAKLCDNAIPGF